MKECAEARITNNLKAMKSTNTYINQFTSLNQRTSLRERVSSFVEQHAGVFHALTRHGLPYGGNWMAAAQPDSFQPLELTAETMIEVERELDDIILRLSQLSNNLGQSAGSTQSQAGNRLAGRTNEIGIDRFRALQFEA
jgi:hypothetical protein